MKTKTATQLLRDAVKTEFSSHVADLGFVKEKRHDSSGLVYFYRRALDQRHDLLEAQFDQYHRPKVVLNFGSVPATGLFDGYGRRHSAEEVCCCHLVQTARLYRVFLPFFRQWFRLSRLDHALTSPDKAARQEVSLMIARFVEVENWLKKEKSARMLRSL
ncbi:MAG: hypothetical protein KF710_12810 [Rhodocyclaceae bacterium]|nr:hypothetical protein [Rhodocyclaceae bacterium]